MAKVNIRESLGRLDLLTDNKYDLRNTYDCSNISNDKKKKLAESISNNASAKQIYNILNEAFNKDGVNVTEKISDDVRDGMFGGLIGKDTEWEVFFESGPTDILDSDIEDMANDISNGRLSGKTNNGVGWQIRVHYGDDYYDYNCLNCPDDDYVGSRWEEYDESLTEAMKPSDLERYIMSVLKKHGFDYEHGYSPDFITDYNDNTKARFIEAQFSDGLDWNDYKIIKKTLKNSGIDVYPGKEHKDGDLLSVVFELNDSKNESLSLKESYIRDIIKLVRDSTNKYSSTYGKFTPARFDSYYINDLFDEFYKNGYSVSYNVLDYSKDYDDLSNQEYWFEKNESLTEDTVKQNGKWVNKGEEGTHGKFKTKKEADAQRKAMFANGYKGESLKESVEDDYMKHADADARKVKSLYRKNKDIDSVFSSLGYADNEDGSYEKEVEDNVFIVFEYDEDSERLEYKVVNEETRTGTPSNVLKLSKKSKNESITEDYDEEKSVEFASHWIWVKDKNGKWKLYDAESSKEDVNDSVRQAKADKRFTAVKVTENGKRPDGHMNVLTSEGLDEDWEPDEWEETDFLDDDGKKVYINIIKEAEDIDDLKDIAHDLYWHDKGLFAMLRNFPKDKSFEWIQNRMIEVIKSTMNESLTEDTDDEYNKVKCIDEGKIWDSIKNVANKQLRNHYYNKAIRAMDSGNTDKEMTYIDKAVKHAEKTKEYKQGMQQLQKDVDNTKDKFEKDRQKTQDRLKKIKEESLTEASYGGAYDIEDDMFWTKDDLIEFSDAVCEKLADKFGYQYDIADVGAESNNDMYITIMDTTHDIEADVSFRIKMSRIRSPRDLMKYLDTVVSQFVKKFEEEYQYYDFDESLNEDMSKPDFVVGFYAGPVDDETLELVNPKKILQVDVSADELKTKYGKTVDKLLNDYTSQTVDKLKNGNSTLKAMILNFAEKKARETEGLDDKFRNEERKFLDTGIYMDSKLEEVNYPFEDGIKKLSKQLGKMLLPKRENLTEDVYDEESDFGDGSVEEGDTFIEDGRTWSWIERIAGPIHLDFDNWSVWSARDWDYIEEKVKPLLVNKEEFNVETLTKIYDEAEVAYFVVDEDTGFIDWGPVESQTEAQDFLNGKVEDWENDEEYDESLKENKNLKESWTIELEYEYETYDGYDTYTYEADGDDVVDYITDKMYGDGEYPDFLEGQSDEEIEDWLSKKENYQKFKDWVEENIDDLLKRYEDDVYEHFREQSEMEYYDELNDYDDWKLNNWSRYDNGSGMTDRDFL